MTAIGSGRFGVRLRALREAAGLSQEELAERAGLSSHAVSALERGTRTRPYPHTVRALADALGADDAERTELIASVPARGRTPTSDSTPARRPGRGQLPRPATPLLGRETAVARVTDLLQEHRLVTLTGIGGVGKTRLALAVAEAVEDRYADGVCWVALAPITDPNDVLLAIADAVGAGPLSDSVPVTAVAERLSGQQLLIVLDNLEHVLDVAPDVAALLASAPGVTVLATSRAPLRIRGETEMAVEPLGLPGPAYDGSGRSPAVQLLLDRAGATSPGWGTRPEDAAAVAGVAVGVAGVPLALELAAARARLLDPPSLLARLGEALDTGARDLPARQRTMRATLDWSYGLLDVHERGLLRLLSVFSGGVRLDDLEAVASRARLPGDLLASLHTLVEHSLVLPEDGPGGHRRYRMLEPVAQYARDRLVEEQESATSHAAHLDHYLALAELESPHFRDGDQVAALARIDAEHPNLAAAADRGLEAGRVAEVARLAWALWMYWWLRGHHAQGRRIAEGALAHPLPADLLPLAELAAATMCFATDDVAAGRTWWERAEAHAVEVGDPLATANGAAGVGLAAIAAGDLAEARRHLLRAAAAAEAAGPGGEWTGALTQIWLGTVALGQGDPDAAVEHVGRGLASARRRGDLLTAYVGLYNLSQVELTRGRHAAARGHLEEGMRLSLETGDLANLAYLLDATAAVEAAEGVHESVPVLFGAAQAIRETIGAHGYHYYRPVPESIDAAVADATRALGADAYDDGLDRGRGLSPEEAVDLALRRSAAAG